jgi:hypothetical protein
MSKINAEYTLNVKISELMLQPNTSRIDVEKKVRELAKARINQWIMGNLYDPESKVFTESFKITPSNEE